MMESFGKKQQTITLAALMAFGIGSEVKAAGHPAEKVTASETASVDYTPIEKMLSGKPAREVHTSNVSNQVYTEENYDKSKKDSLSESRENKRYTEKTTSVEANHHKYTAVVEYINGEAFQYRFGDKNDSTGIETVTIDGGREIYVRDSMYHQTKFDTLSDGTIQPHDLVLGRGAHIDITRPDGRPDKMIITAKNGAQIILTCKYGKDGTNASDWEVSMEGQVKPIDEDAKKSLVARALNNHALVPLQFKKSGSKLTYTSPDQASGDEE